MKVYTKTDYLSAFLVFVIIAAVGCCSLTAGLQNWGDDNAAYISEGIAIANSTFDEQTEINYQYHPSPLPREAEDGKLVYVWGYPLALSVVYRLIGFDRENYSSIRKYKLPLVLSLALLGATLVLFYRRRFPLFASVVLALVFCLNQSMTEALNSLYSDLLFLFFSTVTLLLVECFTDGLKEGGKPVLIGIWFGMAMFATHETRLSGLTICITALIGHMLSLLQKKSLLKKQNLWLHAMPYAVFGIMTLAAEKLWLAPATRNTSDITASRIAKNISSNTADIMDHYARLFGIRLPWLGYAIIALCVIGIIAHGIRENLHLTCLLVGTIIIVNLLDYHQGLRYFYNVLPFVLMYALYGLLYISRRISDRLEAPHRIWMRRAACVAAIGILALSLGARLIDINSNLRSWNKRGRRDVYSANAIETYRYIQDNLPEDAVICFGKPRMLYLNTGRKSIKWGVNGHDLSEADYYLTYKYNTFKAVTASEETLSAMDIIQQNQTFTLYRVNKEEAAGVS